MNKSFWAGCAGLLITVASASAASREEQWKKVDDAVRQGLPKSGVEALEPIIQDALRDKAFAEAAKAITRKLVLEGNIQGNRVEEKITRLEAEIQKAPAEIVPVLDTILAHWYWQYFQQNRARFLQRTITGEAPGKDFTTWDLTRLFAEIDAKFIKALSAADSLKKTPVSSFDDLLDKGTLPDAWRPTLYDFLAHEALKFYTSGEQAAAKPDDAFEISADSPIFGNAENFLLWQPVTTDTNSPKLKTIRLYQELIRFHEKDAEPAAYLDNNLGRLTYGFNVAFGGNKSARYQDQLKAMTENWPKHEVTTLALHRWAGVRQQEGDLFGAHALAVRGADAHPESVAGRMCRTLANQIEARSFRISTERVWNQPWPGIQISYRNLTNLHFRVVASNWESFLTNRANTFEFPGRLTDAELSQLRTKKPEFSWSSKLPETPDYQERVEEILPPEKLKPGFYFIIASRDPEFAPNDAEVSYADVWVSDLALILRPAEGRVEGFVLRANGGEPVQGAQVMGWHRSQIGERVSSTAPITTDKDGFFAYTAPTGSGKIVRASYRIDGQLNEVSSGRDASVPPEFRQVSTTPVILFTDRSLYRPGQTIQFKGISISVDPVSDRYEILAKQHVTVSLLDPNGQNVTQAEHVANDFGSFSGSFTAPRDRVAGRYRIQVQSGANNRSYTTWINVEEYKRPKFQVTLEVPKTPAKLNDKVVLQGKAASYTGAPIDGAGVKYRVVREVRWPIWRSWLRGGFNLPRTASQEIAHATAKTSADGQFTVEFTALPDPAVLESDEASFRFSIFADVTDSSGETRSAQRPINVGFVALAVSIEADAWQIEQKPVELRLKTTSLDDEPLAATGVVKVYRLKAPDKVQRPRLGPSRTPRGGAPRELDLSDPNEWELGDVAVEKPFSTDATGKTNVTVSLGTGVYRAKVETTDRFGKRVTALLPLRVLNPLSDRLVIKVPNLVAAPKWTAEPGDEFTAIWGTGYESGQALVEIEQRQMILQRFWTRPGQTQQEIKHAVTEAMRGGFTLHVTQIRENRAYTTSQRIDVPWSNKVLDLAWEHFTSKLEPSQKETWTVVVKPPEKRGATNAVARPGTSVVTNAASPRPLLAERSVAEMVATLYDASLDAYLPHHWNEHFNFFRSDTSRRRAEFANLSRSFITIPGRRETNNPPPDFRYRDFPRDLTQVPLSELLRLGRRGGGRGGAAPATLGVSPAQGGFGGGGAGGGGRGGRAGGGALLAESLDGTSLSTDRARSLEVAGAQFFAADFVGQAEEKAAGIEGGEGGPNLSQVAARKNLNETAFFFPQLSSDSNGVVRLTFTMPEALTTWRFMGFVHDRDVRSGFVEGKTVTAKDLMVQPNPPRFLREGDILEFTAKVSNQSAGRQSGRVRLTLSDAVTSQNMDKLLSVTSPELEFDIPSKESRSYSWRIQVPDGCPFLTYKVVGSTGRLSDGEEGFLPVLSRRIFLTESLPLWTRGAETKKFEFEKLLKSGGSTTLQHQLLTVQMASNPSWYAVLALPYLMEPLHPTSESIFNRLYANALGRSIANSDPKIKKVFEQWRGTPALESPLEKNQNLKSVALEETPWVRQAKNESEARKNVGLLFDDNRLNSEMGQSLRQLVEMQLSDGSWPWLPGGFRSDHITLYIGTGFGRLRHLGVDIDIAPALRAFRRLDVWMQEHYDSIQKLPDPDAYVPSALDGLYLYGRSFFLKELAVAPEHQKAVGFFLTQARKKWVEAKDRQTQGHLALALKRFNSTASFSSADDSTPAAIMKSIKERSVTTEEMGMFWRDTELSWWWYRAPIETQALMIEAFDEVAGDASAVENARVWLLRQKQTRDWKTTKATADAVYALLLRGKDILSNDKLVEVTLGGNNITPGISGAPSAVRTPQSELRNPVEAGTGFYEARFSGKEITSALASITTKKSDVGLAWGAVHWQYFEDIGKVTPHTSTPLQITKALYTKVLTKKGPELEAVKGPVHVGDELVVRMEIRVDRDMEYVHLKDQRGSGTEPVNVISRHNFRDGLAYYENTRDTASHFFIAYLPKGTYVFEYSTRVQHKGSYQTGVAEIQCLYAPEFNSHSESLALMVH